MEILICTDGSASSLQSADLVTKLGIPTTSRIAVLGVSETESDVKNITESMDKLEHRIGEKFTLTRKFRSGVPSEEILAEALETPYDLVAVGGGGQLGLLHSKLGSTTSNLARKLHTHFLVSRNIPDQIRKVLVCVGADAPSSETISLGGAWIAGTGAQVCLLHVIPGQKTVSAYTTKNDDLPGDMDAAHDPILERASRRIREAGVKSELVLRMRRGLVVDEVLKETSEGGYQLLVVGAHYLPGQDRWLGTLLDDVTDQLLNRSTCSVLII